MKQPVVLALLLALFGALVPRSGCRPISSSTDERTRCTLTGRRNPVLPILVRLGEEHFIRLNDPKRDLRAWNQRAPQRTAGGSQRAVHLRLGPVGLGPGLGPVGLENALTDTVLLLAGSGERKRRGEEPPISLDLTFYLLREVLEMARAEQLAHQASNNRKMMDFFGK